MVSSTSLRADDIETSNTTASLFLGAVRRDWMGPVENRPNRPRNSSRVEMPDNADTAAILSPITPGETLQPISHAAKPPEETTLPSPAQSTTPRPSPVREDPIAASSVPLVSTLPGDEEPMTVQTLSESIAEPLNEPLVGVQSLAQADLPTRPFEDTVSEPRPVHKQNGGSAPGPVIPDETWKGWKLQLKSMEEEWIANGVMQASVPGGTSVLRPRLSLLEQAIDLKDSFYLVIHQLFCLYSNDPSILGRIRAPAAGIYVLNQLLEVNAKMHPSAVPRLAHFPYSPQQLFQQPWYLHELHLVPLFLTRIAHGWLKFWKTARHPPLVSFLSNRFAVTSPTMMRVMFLCISRRIHPEQYISRLEALFWKDWRSTSQCLEYVDLAAFQANNRNTLQEYLKYPRLTPQIHPPDSETGRLTETISPPPETRPSSSPLVNVQSAITPIESPSGPQFVSNQASARRPEPVSRSASWSQRYVDVSNTDQHPSPYQRQMPQGQTPQGPSQRFNSQVPHPVHVPQRQNSQTQNPQTQSPQTHTPQTPSLQAQHRPVRHPQVPNPAVQNTQIQNPQSQNPQMLNPQVQIPYQLQTQAMRRGQLPPHPAYQWAQRQIAQNQGTGTNRAHRLHVGDSATSPVYPSQLVPLTSHVPHSHFAQPPLPTPIPANSSTQLPNGQLASHFPRIQNNQHSVSPQIASPRGDYRDQVSLRPQPSQNRQPMPFFAQAGHKAPYTVNGDPLRLGLHLVHLRDPMKKLLKLEPGGKAVDTELFSYFGAFIVPPTLIDINEPNYTWPIKLSNEDLQRFPRITPAANGSNSVWTYQAGVRTLRLRCIRLDGKPGSVTEKEWAVSSTYWPSVFYVSVNGKDRPVRRKMHFVKDLPLDITEFLIAGDNSLRIDLLLGKDECDKCEYYFGVEVMEVTSFENILRLIQPIPAGESRAAIQKRLAPAANDDDLAVVTNSITINLVDPFTARIFDVPARSRYCTHSECFDRDTFIRTRKSVSGQTPMVDNWRCPVCKVDARPQFLVIDDFLAEIHSELARTDRLVGAEAVQIKVDGSWTLKETTKDDETGTQRDSKAAAGQKRKIKGEADEPVATRPRLQTNPHEVIELD